MKGVLKFNTDGTVCGSFRTVGIGGCLRNDSSKLLLYFFMSARHLDASSTECLAVKEAFSLFNSSRWKGQFVLVIESDSHLVVNWIQNPSYTPKIFKLYIYACLKFGEEFQWSIAVVPRECNLLTDMLAKQGISRVKTLVKRFN
ncbi:hypothetical protein V6N13_067112 [Hibiscus sabdariffa]